MAKQISDMSARSFRARFFSAPRSYRVGREIFWVGLGQAMAALGAIVGVRLLTHLLAPAVYGELALGMTIAALVHQTIMAPLSGASLRFYSPASESGQLRVYLNSVNRLLKRVTIVVLGLLALSSLVSFVLGEIRWFPLVIIAVIFALISGYSGVLDGMQNAARQRVIVAWHDGIAPWLRFLVASALIIVFGAYSLVAMAGYVVAAVVVFLSQFWFYHRRISAVASRSTLPSNIQDWNSQIWIYAWPFIMTGLFVWAQASADRWALQVFDSVEAVGYYAVLYQIGFYPILLAAALMTQLILPILFGRAGDGSDFERLRRAQHMNYCLIIGSLGITGLAALLAAIFHQQIFKLLAAPEYSIVSPLLPWMVLAGGLTAGVQLASLLVMNSLNTQVLIVPRIVGSLFGVLCVFIGAYMYSIPGVIAGNLIFLSIYFIWTLSLHRSPTYLGRIIRRS
jgi:O-antigen/teichoic acid export membrane protein